MSHAPTIGASGAPQKTHPIRKRNCVEKTETHDREQVVEISTPETSICFLIRSGRRYLCDTYGTYFSYYKGWPSSCITAQILFHIEPSLFHSHELLWRPKDHSYRAFLINGEHHLFPQHFIIHLVIPFNQVLLSQTVLWSIWHCLVPVSY